MRAAVCVCVCVRVCMGICIMYMNASASVCERMFECARVCLCTHVQMFVSMISACICP